MASSHHVADGFRRRWRAASIRPDVITNGVWGGGRGISSVVEQGHVRNEVPDNKADNMIRILAVRYFNARLTHHVRTRVHLDVEYLREFRKYIDEIPTAGLLLF